MLKHYHVIYCDGTQESKCFSVKANSKQAAYNKFIEVHGTSPRICEIYNYDKRVSNKKYFAKVLIGVIVITTLFAILAGISVVNCTPVDFEEYIVEEGDTLWDIAKLSNGWNQMDASYIIDAIKEESDCTSTIYPGQVVYIPVYDVN